MDDIREKVLKAMLTDDSFRTLDNFKIRDSYTNASLETQTVLDDIFTRLCGYSLGTIIDSKITLD